MSEQLQRVQTIPKADPFETHARPYDDWFERHPAIYPSALFTLRTFVPVGRRGPQLGVLRLTVSEGPGQSPQHGSDRKTS